MLYSWVPVRGKGTGTAGWGWIGKAKERRRRSPNQANVKSRKDLLLVTDLSAMRTI